MGEPSSREPDFNCRRARLGPAGGHRDARTQPVGGAAGTSDGEEGSHQIVNRSSETVRFLAISNQQPHIVLYPDSQKVGFYGRRPEGGGLTELFRTGDSVDYWEGDQPPS